MNCQYFHRFWVTSFADNYDVLSFEAFKTEDTRPGIAAKHLEPEVHQETA